MWKLELEEKAWSENLDFLGIDEVGYGCAARSLWVAGVILPRGYVVPAELQSIRDSKTTTAAEREELVQHIKRCGIRNFLIEITVDQINAGSPFHLKYDLVDDHITSWPRLIACYDGNYKLKNKTHTNTCLIKGDHHCFSIAAASILAKNAKDKEMTKLAEEYPQYGFDSHQGYLTPAHKEAIRKHGALPCHRISYLKNI